MRCQWKEIEKAFWAKGLKQWIPAILAVSPFLLAQLWFTFLLIKEWSWCETALQITRAKFMHPFTIFQLNILVEWKTEEKDIFLIDVFFGNWAMGLFLQNCLGRCSSAWTGCYRRVGSFCKAQPHIPAFSPEQFFLMPNTFSDKIYRGLKESHQKSDW